MFTLSPVPKRYLCSLLLGIADKYPDYRNFRKFVLAIVEKEINKKTSIGLKWKPLKKGRSVVAVEFEFWDKKNSKAISKVLPAVGELVIDTLSHAQLRAFHRLVAYGVDSEIALQMLQKIMGSETIGFEDWYFEEVRNIFESKTEQTDGAAKAGTLVNWFIKLKIFEQGDHFATIMEQLQQRKKKLQKEQPEAWENRLLARGMSSEEFTKLYQHKV